MEEQRRFRGDRVRRGQHWEVNQSVAVDLLSGFIGAKWRRLEG